MNRTLKFTIAFSLLIHLAFLWPLLSLAPQKQAPASQPQDKTVEITLTQPQPKVAPSPPIKPKPEDKPPPPRHTEDDIEKANTSDGIAEESGGKPTQAKQKGEGEASKPSNQKQFIATQKAAKRAEALKSIFGQETKLAGGAQENNEAKLDEISDNELDNSLVKSPLTKAQEEKARWYNEVLRKIGEQISYIWVKPEGVSARTRGVIQLKLDQQGYLLSSWIHLPSGNPDLDDSALRAIRGVIRYQIPNSPSLYRYYKNLKFEYSGG
mgnify:CR=1 FL=1